MTSSRINPDEENREYPDIEPDERYFSEDGSTHAGYYYPLVWRAVDPIHPADGKPPTLEDMLTFIAFEAEDDSLEGAVRRYNEITDEEGPNILHSTPAEVRIASRLVWPLRHAKASYMLGDNLGVIAQCGMVAEMVAMLLFDMADLKHGEQPLDGPLQKKLFGNTFELLGQQRRVAVLVEYGLITSEQKGWFTEIRNIRRGYLHIFSNEALDASADARKAFRFALAVVFMVLGSEDPERPTKMRDDLELFMVRNGCPLRLEPPKELQKDAYPRKPRTLGS
jgi:hypothetical protein